MARGKRVSIQWDMVANSKTNYLEGSDANDIFNIQWGMRASGNVANHISLGDGNDIVKIGYGMQGLGNNIIEGGFGNKTVTMKRDMVAEFGSNNTISFGGQTTDIHHINVASVKATYNNSTNMFLGTDGADYLTATGSFSAVKGGRNVINWQHGDKTIDIQSGMYSEAGGSNEISLGIGEHYIDSKSMNSVNAGINRISSMAGDSVITIDDGLWGSGTNEIVLGYGEHDIFLGTLSSSTLNGSSKVITDGTTYLSIYGGMTADHSYNEISTSFGDDVIEITTDVNAKNNGYNYISTGDGDDTVTIGGRLYAAWGQNYITTGDGDDYVSVKGGSTSSNGSYNIIHTGDGNDTIHLSNIIGRDSLELNAGDGYDTLILDGCDLRSFNYGFSSWLTNIDNTTGIDSMGIDSIQVNVGERFSLHNISWLTQMLNDNNNADPNSHIDMSINIDDFGMPVTLSGLFTNSDESAINGIDLTGCHANVLNIRGSLNAAGYDNQTLQIKGNSEDTVLFDNNWESAGITTDQNTGDDFYVFHNVQGEDVMVQAGMNILYV